MNDPEETITATSHLVQAQNYLAGLAAVLLVLALIVVGAFEVMRYLLS